MGQALITAVLILGVFFAALTASFSVMGAVHLTAQRQSGWLHYCFYSILIAVAAYTVLSGRDLSKAAGLLGAAEVVGRHPIDAWAQRGVTIFLLLASGERIVSAWLRQKSNTQSPPLLLPTYVLFWLATVAAPALFGAHLVVSHEYIYPLLIGWGALLLSAHESEQAVASARNAILIFIVAGFLLIPINSKMVLEFSYGQGLMPGLPRLAGLAPHAVSLGMIVQAGLLCLWVLPLQSRWLNRLAWGIGLSAFFLAQSKTAWLSFSACAFILAYVRHGASFQRRFFNPKSPTFGILIVSILMTVATVISAEFVLTDMASKLANFSDTSEGAQLTSLTGRDKIWAVAFNEWTQNPIFGYGPDLFSDAHRNSVGMSFATNAHNQFMDTLARSGLVGASALVIYVLLLLALSFRYSKTTGGLSAALFVAIALRGISEVPLNLFSYGPEFISHILLLMVLAGAARGSHALSLKDAAKQ